MKEYTIWFEIYGKKMKATVCAKSEAEAKQVILNKVLFHKVEVSLDEDAKKMYDSFMDILK